VQIEKGRTLCGFGLSHSEAFGREGLNVGFPPLTHDRVPVRELKHNTCWSLQQLLTFIHFRNKGEQQNPTITK
jgi:hypothetical protein